MYATVPYMVTDRDEGGSYKRFTDLPRACYGSPTDRHGAPSTGLRMKRLHKGLFLIRKSFPCQSIADSVRSGYVLGDICRRGCVKDERDATRTSRMGLRTIRTLTDELRMRYGRATDTKVRKDFTQKSNSLIFA